MTSAPGIVLPVPDLGDELVRLRSWRSEDAPALVAAWHDLAVVAGSRPPDDRSEVAAVRWIEGWDERRRAGLALDLVAADPYDDRVLGEVGLARLDERRRAASIGWWVASVDRRRGVATRAVALLVDWVLAEGRLDAVVAEIPAGNEASRRVAAACRFTGLRPATADRPGVWARHR